MADVSQFEIHSYIGELPKDGLPEVKTTTRFLSPSCLGVGDIIVSVDSPNIRAPSDPVVLTATCESALELSRRFASSGHHIYRDDFQAIEPAFDGNLIDFSYTQIPSAKGFAEVDARQPAEILRVVATDDGTKQYGVIVWIAPKN